MPDLIYIEDIIDDNVLFSEDIMKPIRESIKEQGLHHPLLVACVYDPEDESFSPPGGWQGAARGEKQYKLIAGKKRFLALKQLGIREVPVKIYPSTLTADQSFEISLHENLKRWNLPWYEQVETERALHELRQKQNGKAQPGQPKLTQRGKEAWTQADTARELGIAIGVLNEDLQLARAIAVNPSLKRVKDKTTAMKLIRVQAKRMEAEAFALIESDFKMNQVFLGDSATILPNIPDRTFDVCITDPPWSTYERGEDAEATLTSEQINLLPIFIEVFRVLKNDSFLYLITSSVDFPFYTIELPKIGFRVQQYPLIWQKTRSITHGKRSWEYARDYEPILLAVKGNPILTKQVEISSVLLYPNLHYTKMIHPNEKPIELIDQIIGDSSYEGSSILDPFAGSGVVLSSAKKNRRNYIGIEENKKYYDQIVNRLEK